MTLRSRLADACDWLADRLEPLGEEEAPGAADAAYLARRAAEWDSSRKGAAALGHVVLVYQTIDADGDVALNMLRADDLAVPDAVLVTSLVEMLVRAAQATADLLRGDA